MLPVQGNPNPRTIFSSSFVHGDPHGRLSENSQFYSNSAANAFAGLPFGVAMPAAVPPVTTPPSILLRNNGQSPSSIFCFPYFRRSALHVAPIILQLAYSATVLASYCIIRILKPIPAICFNKVFLPLKHVWRGVTNETNCAICRIRSVFLGEHIVIPLCSWQVRYRLPTTKTSQEFNQFSDSPKLFGFRYHPLVYP